MKTTYSIVLLLLCHPCFSQQKINEPLQKELLSILSTDQGIREYVVGNPTETRKDSLAKILGYERAVLDTSVWNIMNIIDQKNAAIVEKIITQYGYPGKSLVGEPANTAVFYVIQHSPKLNNISL